MISRSNGFVRYDSSSSRCRQTIPAAGALQNRCRPSKLNSIPEQQPGESDMDFIRRLQKLASDPVEFERTALRRRSQEETKSIRRSQTDNNTQQTNDDVETAPPKKRGVYQRVEEWDKQQKKVQSEFAWEERVRFDGQRYGNRFKQNEILRKNLD